MLFELPHVLELAQAASAGSPEAERCEFVAGDFMVERPPAAPLLLLKKVIHDWPDERATTILGNCRAALPAGGRLLVMENVIVPGNEPSFATWLDLLMLVYAGGRERTVEEFGTLLAGSGFQLQHVIPTAVNINVLEAVAT